MMYLRTAFDEACRKREGNRCAICGVGQVPMSAHHITDRHLLPNDGYVESNGILLCDEPSPYPDKPEAFASCHWKAEQYHISGGKKVAMCYHPLDLYAQIGSSPEKAWKDSRALGDDDEHDLLIIVDRDGKTELYFYKGEPVTADKALEVMIEQEQ